MNGYMYYYKNSPSGTQKIKDMRLILQKFEECEQYNKTHSFQNGYNWDGVILSVLVKYMPESLFLSFNGSFEVNKWAEDQIKQEKQIMLRKKKKLKPLTIAPVPCTKYSDQYKN